MDRHVETVVLRASVRVCYLEIWTHPRLQTVQIHESCAWYAIEDVEDIGTDRNLSSLLCLK
jgi:hypothetical protein